MDDDDDDDNDVYQYANEDVDYLSDSDREFLMALQWLACHDDRGFFEDCDDDDDDDDGDVHND